MITQINTTVISYILTNDGSTAQLYNPLPVLSMASTPGEVKLNEFKTY